MNISKTQKVLTTHIFFIVIIGLFSYFATSGSVQGHAMVGLAIGAVSSVTNYFALHLMMKFLTGGNPFLAVQCYMLRMLIYLGGAFLSVRQGIEGAATFGAAIIAISVAIFIVYGIGGLKNND